MLIQRKPNLDFQGGLKAELGTCGAEAFNLNSLHSFASTLLVHTYNRKNSLLLQWK